LFSRKGGEEGKVFAFYSAPFIVGPLHNAGEKKRRGEKEKKMKPLLICSLAPGFVSREEKKRERGPPVRLPSNNAALGLTKCILSGKKKRGKGEGAQFKNSYRAASFLSLRRREKRGKRGVLLFSSAKRPPRGKGVKSDGGGEKEKHVI